MTVDGKILSVTCSFVIKLYMSNDLWTTVSSNATILSPCLLFVIVENLVKRNKCVFLETPVGTW